MAASATDKVFDELGKMTVLELVELKKKIEDEWGITAAAPVAVAAPGAAGAGGDGAAVEEKSSFDVVLTAAEGVLHDRELRAALDQPRAERVDLRHRQAAIVGHEQRVGRAQPLRQLLDDLRLVLFLHLVISFGND